MKKNNVICFKSNLSSEKNIRSVLYKINKKVGKAQILINCIGIFSSKTILDLDLKEIENLLRNNLIYPLLLIKNFIKISTTPKKYPK